MHMGIATLALIIAAVMCFILGIVNVQPSQGRPVNWVSLGLCLLVLAWLVRGS